MIDYKTLGIPVVEMLIPAGRFNRPGRASPCRYITIHETGNYIRTANAAAHGRYLQGDSANDMPVSWHYTVDDSGVVRHIPDCEDAYHAGDGAGEGNRSSIGIELCVNIDGNFEQTLKNAAQLVAALMAEHRIPLERVVQHNRWNGKNCPYTLRREGRWEEFLALCAAALATDEPLDAEPAEQEQPPAYWQAVETLAACGLLDSPDYWKGDSYSAENVRHLLTKWAQSLR